jgi:hypothetical protein
MRWGAGVRALYLYFDAAIQFPGAGTDRGTFLSQRETNHLTGYGFFANLELERKLPGTNFAVFGFVEASDLYVRISQTFSERLSGGPGAPPVDMSSRFTWGVGVPTLRGMVGLSYTVPWWNYSRFALGYEYEVFFQIGRLSVPTGGGSPDDRGQLDAQGLFLRAEFNF